MTLVSVTADRLSAPPSPSSFEGCGSGREMFTPGAQGSPDPSPRTGPECRGLYHEGATRNRTRARGHAQHMGTGEASAKKEARKACFEGESEVSPSIAGSRAKRGEAKSREELGQGGTCAFGHGEGSILEAATDGAEILGFL